MKKSFNVQNSPPEFPRDEVRAAISKGIQQAEQQRNLHEVPLQVTQKRKRKPLLYVASAVATFGILLGSAYVSPTLASTLSQLPIIGSVFSDSGLLGLKQASEQGLTSAVGKTTTINGISVTVNEVLYDETKITVGLTIESDKELSKEYFGAGMEFTINGDSPEGYTGGYWENIISPTVRTSIMNFDVTKEMPQSFELGLSLEGANEEQWAFSTPIEKIPDTIRVPVNHQQQADGIQLNVAELSLSPSGVGISFEASEKGSISNPQLEASYIEFRMTDERGQEITSHSGGFRGNFYDGVWVFGGKKTFDPIATDVKELTITPYLSLPSGGGGVAFNEHGEETEIKFDASSLKEVEFQPFTVTLPAQKEK